MTGQQLKNSILQMAVQGKLVPQDPNDEPASVLLERIRKEKEQLIKDGKIKKEKNPSIIFRGADNLPYEKVDNNEPVCIADEVPFDIPDSWEWVRLGSIGDWGSGATPSRTNAEYYGGDIPWLKTGDLNDGYIKQIPENISHLALEKTSVRLNETGSVLIAMYGATIGKVGILTFPATTNQACCACLPIKIYNEYLFYFLMSQKLAFIKQGEGGAQPNISKQKIIATLMPLPSIAEQHRIVTKIKEILPLVEQYEVACSEVNSLNNSFSELLKKSILQEAVQGKLVPQDPNDEPASVLLERIRAEKQALIKAGKIKKNKNESIIFRRDNSHYEKLNGIERCIDDEIPFEIPDNWEWCRLYSIVKKDIKRGKSPKYSECGQNLVFSQKCNTKHGTINLLLAKYLDEVTFTKYPTEEYLTNNDIIINSTGHGTLGRVGFFCGNDRISNAIIVPDSHITIIRCFETVTNKYIFYILKFYQPFLEKLGEGSTNQTELKPATIANLLIPMPPSNEQHKIVEKIEASLQFCKKL